MEISMFRVMVVEVERVHHQADERKPRGSRSAYCLGENLRTTAEALARVAFLLRTKRTRNLHGVRSGVREIHHYLTNTDVIDHRNQPRTTVIGGAVGLTLKVIMMVSSSCCIVQYSGRNNLPAE